jgi:hypothetical protein
MVRIVPEEASDRAIEFPMTENGSAFAPELGVTDIDIYEVFDSDYYVDFLGARIGEVLEFFTVDGTEAAPVGEVVEVIKSTSKDSIKLKDGREVPCQGAPQYQEKTGYYRYRTPDKRDAVIRADDVAAISEKRA